MDIKEQNHMSFQQETNHWWIQTRFNYIDRAFSILQSNNIHVLEVGYGTGPNLWYIHQHLQHAPRIKQSIGIDPNATDLNSAHHIDLSKTLLVNHFSDINIKVELLLAMDVLEHIEDDLNALKQWKDTLKKDGMILITVPAFSFLWSYHDDFLDHKRRYTKSSLLSITQKCNLQPLYLSYAFGHIFPIAYILRKCVRKNNQAVGLRPTNSFINYILKFLGKIESRIGGSPFGTSVIGIFQKV